MWRCFFLCLVISIMSPGLYVVPSERSSFFFFLRLNSIPWRERENVCVCVCVCVCVKSHFLHPSIHPLTVAEVVSILWLLWIMLQWTWECRDLFEIVIIIPFGIYSEVGLLDHIIVLFLIFEDSSLLFFIMVVPIYIPTNNV